MLPLPEKFDKLARWLIDERDNLEQGTGVPFVRLIYHPSEERECQRLTVVLRERLTKASLTSHEIRCGELLFKYYAEKNQLELRLKTAEANPHTAGDEIGKRAEAELLAAILNYARQAPPSGNIIISETAQLYPFAHLSGVLDSCENQVRIPLVLLYPATIEDEKLLFVGRRETGYYRTRNLR